MANRALLAGYPRNEVLKIGNNEHGCKVNKTLIWYMLLIWGHNKNMWTKPQECHRKWPHHPVRYFRAQWDKIGSFKINSDLHICVECEILMVDICWWLNSTPPGQNRLHFSDDIFRCIFVNEKICILIKISLKFVPKGPIDNKPALV